MDVSQLEPQLNEIEAFLQTYGLIAERIHRPDLRKLVPANFRNMDYRTVWETHYKEHLFHFLLKDRSMLLFKVILQNSRLHLSYIFLDAPLSIPTYENFLELHELSYEEVGDEFWNEYEEFLSSAQNRNSAVPIRYDYDISAYRPGCHPASHLHIGFESNIRVATDRILQPISFVYFVVRQFYPETWEKFINTLDAEVKCRRVRTSLDDIDVRYKQLKDNWEMRFY